MPVEIKELIVKTTIDNSPQGEGQGINLNISQIKDEIINECVYSIMEQLDKNKER